MELVHRTRLGGHSSRFQYVGDPTTRAAVQCWSRRTVVNCFFADAAILVQVHHTKTVRMLYGVLEAKARYPGMQPTRALISLAELAAGKPMMLIKGNFLTCDTARGTTSIKAVVDRCNIAVAYSISLCVKPSLRNLSVMYSLATCSHAASQPKRS